MNAIKRRVYLNVDTFDCYAYSKQRLNSQFIKELILLFALPIILLSCQEEKKESANIKFGYTSEHNIKDMIKVVDTDFSKGRIGLEHAITLEDLEKFHGHLCDGLVVGFQALDEAFKVLYPNEQVDRTNTRIVSKASPCLTDAAIYLTGGRYQYNTFYVGNDIKGLFVVQRMDTKKAVIVNMKNGIKPPEIDSLGSLATKGKLNGCQLDSLKIMEDNFSNFLLKTNPSENFTIKVVSDFDWDPIMKNDFTKTDILNKNKTNCNQ